MVRPLRYISNVIDLFGRGRTTEFCTFGESLSLRFPGGSKFGRFASTKSLHVHELRSDGSGGGVLNMPQYWNSLGVITPLEEEPSHYNSQDFRKRENSVQDMRVYGTASLDSPDVTQSCVALAGNQAHPKCHLENLNAVTLLSKFAHEWQLDLAAVGSYPGDLLHHAVDHLPPRAPWVPL